MRRSSMRRNKNSITGLTILFVLAIVVVFGFDACTTSVKQANVHTEIATICGKESVHTGSGDNRSHEYRVYTSGSTYVVEDYYGIGGIRLSSADLYGHIKVGETYIIRSYGYRIPWASSFWNIESITPTQQEPTGTCG